MPACERQLVSRNLRTASLPFLDSGLGRHSLRSTLASLVLRGNLGRASCRTGTLASPVLPPRLPVFFLNRSTPTLLSSASPRRTLSTSHCIMVAQDKWKIAIVGASLAFTRRGPCTVTPAIAFPASTNLDPFLATTFADRASGSILGRQRKLGLGYRTPRWEEREGA